MDGELTAIPSSNGEGNGDVGDSLDNVPDTCREIFDNAFPNYLAMGMTYNEFYREDHTLAISYRRAYEKKRKKENEDMWLQGCYVYEAIARLSPLLIPFNSHPKAEPYLKEPFPMFEKDGDEDAKSKAVSDKGQAYMFAQMKAINKKFGITG